MSGRTRTTHQPARTGAGRPPAAGPQPELFDRITFDPNVMGGRGSIRGMRIPVSVIVRLPADACVDIRIAEWLRGLGHDVRHLRYEGLPRLPDGAVFDKAITEDAEIAAASGGRGAGVLLPRLRDTRAVHVIDRLSAVLPACERALVRPAVVVVEESRYGIRPLPIGRTEDPT